MTHNRRNYFLTVAVLCVLPLAVGSCSVDRRLNPNLDRKIAGPVLISTEWMEIAPQEPLKPERELHEVIIWLPNPYSTDRKSEQKNPTDLSAIPEVQLVDQNGNVLNLKVSSRDHTSIGFSFRDESHREVLPKDRVYRAIRLRSDKPIEVKSIVWRCYNPWDHK